MWDWSKTIIETLPQVFCASVILELEMLVFICYKMAALKICHQVIAEASNENSL